MNYKKYPEVVCLDCLSFVEEDTLKEKGKLYGKKSTIFSVYDYKCEICGEVKQCTDPRDFGYPDFDIQIIRIKKKK